ncbi:potassium channel family protein [Vibrio sp. DW001]|uniref:potassium channel family protein n=1 Tax=Vibrio sp. DW001 TaxID=2912315 RepID=UPI0023AF5C00|nr:potassium channel family protein [Vibrio sp. DW001]WED28119.1 potassium channel family protein [Vibrio sp. DW001]
MSWKTIWLGLINWVFPILVITPLIMYLHVFVENSTVYALTSACMIFIYYVFTFFRLESTLSKTHRYDMAMIPVVYVLVLIIVAALFSFPFIMTNAFLNTGKYISSFDIFYYCMISLTSVGYGDLSPVSTAERILAIGMSLVGTLHMVMFISVLVGKLSVLNKKS